MSSIPVETYDPKHYIIIKGAAVHNLKKIDVAIPRNHFVVVTGVSGSGKSSLVFDTLYAEGQRRYVESLSSYARQFMGRMEKPAVDYIKGIAPAIAIEQKVNTRNPRSTVGTSTEIYDYLKLLFARVGTTVSPISGREVKKENVSDVTDYIKQCGTGKNFLITTPVDHLPDRSIIDELKILLQKGFSRILLGNQMLDMEDYIQNINSNESETASIKIKKPAKNKPDRTEPKPDIKLVVDRLYFETDDEDMLTRIADSVQIAFNEGNGICIIIKIEEDGKWNERIFSNRFEADGMKFEIPSTNLFAFNNPYGACKRCEGFGSVIGIDQDLVIPDKSLSVYDGAIVCWRGEKMSEWNRKLIMNAYHFDFPIHKPYHELTDKQKQLLWKGNEYFEGLDTFFRHIEEQAYKIQYRVMLSRYRGKTVCPDCKGSRLRPDANYVKIGGLSITDIVLMPVNRSFEFFKNVTLTQQQSIIAKRLLVEITNRLQFLCDVGLGYLTLNRLSNTLSGGESQRINLATSLGSSLVGSMYILDEPSIGLHPRDTERLIHVLKSLKKLGNTLIVVEHDEEIMQAADELIDIGPEAGKNGGCLIYQGPVKNIGKVSDSLTGAYLTGKDKIIIPERRRPWRNFIEVKGARENNLKNLNVKFPLGIMIVVTGVSGSGKTSLVKKVLYPALRKIAGGYHEESGNYDHLSGDYRMIAGVEMIDQNPIGKSSRSNPVTYVKAYDEIRELYALQPMARMRNFKASHFSFNVEGGRCETCQGEGEVTVEMQFMADIHLRCDACQGKRFKNEILDIQYKGLCIYDILEMTVDEAIAFFSDANTTEKFKAIEQKIISRLLPLQNVGMGYVKLGQSSSTLSGGEAQRIKLASYLIKGNDQGRLLFIFDEPTTGLHFHDIDKLLTAFNALIANGHSLIIIEHNPEVIKCADWIIDLGPEGGENGGHIIFQGTPEDLVQCKESQTAKYIAPKLMLS